MRIRTHWLAVAGRAGLGRFSAYSCRRRPVRSDSAEHMLIYRRVPQYLVAEALWASSHLTLRARQNSLARLPLLPEIGRIA